MNANVNFGQILAAVKAGVGLASLAIISIICLKAFGVHLPYVQGNMTELSAVAAAAAFISR
jgi:hypothetical protein